MIYFHILYISLLKKSNVLISITFGILWGFFCILVLNEDDLENERVF